MLTDKQLKVLNSLLNETHTWYAMWVGETATCDEDDDTQEREEERIKEVCEAFNLVYNAVTHKLERA